MVLEHRPYQIRLQKQAVKAYASGMGSILIESPTGSGKTVIGHAIVQEMQKRGLIKTCAWVAMRRNLLAQAARENDDKFGLKGMYYVSMFDKHPPKVDMLIADEAQHDAANSMAHLHNIIQPKHILGLTATPFRTDHMKLCFEKVLKDAGIRALIDDGYLAPYRHFVMKEYSWQSVADLYVQEQERWGKSLMFFLTKEECYLCQDRLRKNGVPCEVVTGETNREAQLEAFERNDIKVVINVFVLSEGFDCPDLKTVFIRPSSKGPTIQMGGRVFRKAPGKEFAQIVQCAKTKWPFIKTASPEGQWLQVMVNGELVWRSITPNSERIRIGWANSLRAIAHTDVVLPKIVTASMSRGFRRRMDRIMGDTNSPGAIPGIIDEPTHRR